MPENPFELFPEDTRADVDGLIWLGYLEDVVHFCGHTFTIRTLRGDEELMAGLVCKEYMETLGQAKSHVWATVALALYVVDGDEEFCPPASPDKKVFARARFNWATSNWYWPVALHLYNKYLELLDRQEKALEAVEDFCKGNLHTLMPSVGSSTDKASSPQEEIMDYLNDEDFPPSS